MYIGIHKPSAKNGANRGSSKNLMEYLSKEDRANLDYITDDKLEEIQNFYDKNNEEMNHFEAIKLIDQHAKGLEKKDTKFFMLTINPSQKEMNHLKEISQNNEQELKESLKKYTQIVMNEYAKNFKRELDGKPLTIDSLNYVARIETERSYAWNDKAVLHNQEVKKTNKGEFLTNSKGEVIKEGMKKEGNQEHIHVLVSRYDSQKRMKLSPHAIAKTSKDNHVVAGKNVTIGFNHVDFKINCEKAFDRSFEYERGQEKTAENSIKSKSNRLTRGGAVLNEQGDVNVENLVQKGIKITSTLVTNPDQVLGEIGKASHQQIKKIAVPEVDENPIKDAKKQLDLRMQMRQKISSAVLKGGLEME